MRTMKTFAVFLDMQKAFESVSHNVLLNKLTVFGFDDSVIRLIFSCWSIRFQRVPVNRSVL